MVEPVLTSFDDYPIHQGTLPVAHTATADLNHYDRYFFNGYTTDASLYFAAAMGLYPNRHVADAAFSVVVAGREQINVHASRRAPDDRKDANEVGPIRVVVIEPLRVLQLLVEAPEHGLRADLTFRARSEAMQEPHFFQQTGVRVLFDYTRLTQFGTWHGWIEVDGERTQIDSSTTWGSRDRSWGIRPVGERGPTGAPVGEPQFYWLWAPINFGSYSTHFDINEYGDGRRWHETGFVAPVGDATPEAMRTVDYRVEWESGTRWARSFEIDLIPFDGETRTITLEPLYNFMMLGIGYTHPEWGHGVWKGENESGGDRWELPVSDPCAPQHVHVQTICRARCGDDEGIGILEQFVIGRHTPTGLTGFFDGAP
jgi:hypothetical protein